MRIALAGKGGAGKTTISATIARLAARAGRSVLAIDADANPNLALALGPTADPALVRALPPELVSRRPGGPGLRRDVELVLAEHAARGPDGIELLAMGSPAHADEGCLCSAHAVVSAVLEDLGARRDLVLVDMEASPEHFSRGTIRHVDLVCLVAEPYYRSLETVRRMAELAAELPVGEVVVLANKIRSETDGSAVGAFCARHDLTLAGAIPWSEGVGAADRLRVSLLDCPEAADVVRAVNEVCAGWLQGCAGRSDQRG